MSRKEQINDPLLQEAKERSTAVRKIDADESLHFWELGEHCDAVHTKKLFKVLGLKSFKAWLQKYVPASRRKSYSAMKCWRNLKEIPAKERKTLPIQNAKALASMTESKRFNQKWRKRAMEMTEADFLAAIEADKVGAEKSEEMIVKHLKFEKTAWSNIQKVIDHLMNFHDCKTPTEAIEMMAVVTVQELQIGDTTCVDMTDGQPQVVTVAPGTIEAARQA